MTNNSEVIHIKPCHCFINQFVWDRFFVFILKSFFFWKDFRCSPTIIIEETALDSKSFSNILFSISLLLSAVDVEFLKLEDLKLVCIYFLGVKCSLILLLLVSQSRQYRVDSFYLFSNCLVYQHAIQGIHSDIVPNFRHFLQQTFLTQISPWSVTVLRKPNFPNRYF